MAANFDERWEQRKRYNLRDPEPEYDPYCGYSRQFQAWAEQLAEGLLAKITTVTMNQAKLQLQDKWHEWRATVPTGHWQEHGEHACVDAVYLGMYQKLRATELVINPPLLYTPAPLHEQLQAGAQVLPELPELPERHDPHGIVIAQLVDGID